MKNSNYLFVLAISSTLIFGCKINHQSEKNENMKEQKGTFSYDINFLKTYDSLIILKDEKEQSQLIISPKLQARVMTSTLNGEKGFSFGWINYDFFKNGGDISSHFHPYGGEERFWLGPEGGQYSLFFKKSTSFEFDNWFVPKEIDIESFILISNNNTKAFFKKDMHLTNYAGINFNFSINRNIRLLNKKEISQLLNIQLTENIKVIGYETENILTNKDSHTWKKDDGLMSMWILSMFNPSPNVTVIIPFKPNSNGNTEDIIHDNYFGRVDNSRCKIKDSTIFFKADGKYRSKIGIGVKNTRGLCGSYDEDNKILTIASFNFSADGDYVKSQWEIHKQPYSGDAVNSYNDGPVEDGSQMGPFYEIESSSPAKALKTGENITHYHRTFHFVGNEEVLNKLAIQILGASIKDIKEAF